MDTLRNKIAAASLQMKGRFEELRASFAQSGNKGGGLEDVVRDFLRLYLPRKYAVGHGEVIDTYENRSKQTDVVIVNDNHPFTFAGDIAGLFFIEGVAAVAEVKALLTSEHLTKTIESSRTFKTLQPQIPDGTMWFSNDSDDDRFLHHPPCFLLAMESQLILPSIVAKLESAVTCPILNAHAILDAVFIMDVGWAINFGDGKGSLKFARQDGEPATGWIWQESDSTLFDLLGWLFCVMPFSFGGASILRRYLMRQK